MQLDKQAADGRRGVNGHCMGQTITRLTGAGCMGKLYGGTANWTMRIPKKIPLMQEAEVSSRRFSVHDNGLHETP